MSELDALQEQDLLTEGTYLLLCDALRLHFDGVARRERRDEELRRELERIGISSEPVLRRPLADDELAQLLNADIARLEEEEEATSPPSTVASDPRQALDFDIHHDGVREPDLYVLGPRDYYDRDLLGFSASEIANSAFSNQRRALQADIAGLRRERSEGL